MPGAAITTQSLAMGICTNHQNPIFWTGIIIPEQGNVLINGVPAAVDFNNVVTSCGHLGFLISNNSITSINGLRSCGGMTQVLGPGVTGWAYGTAGNVLAA